MILIFFSSLKDKRGIKLQMNKKKMDYTKILNREIERVKKVQKEFLETPSKSY